MENRGIKIALKTTTIIIVFFIIIHTSISFLLIRKSTITGEISLDIKDNILKLSPLNKKILLVEWLVIIIIVGVILLREKLKLNKEMKDSEKILKIPSSKLKRSEPETDLDLLYKLLKENKSLRISAISKIFKVSKEVALEWCKILEEGDLAVIYYPTFGDPKVILNSDDEKKEEKQEKEKKSK